MVYIEVYKESSCQACQVEVPRIIRECKALGIDVRVYDLDTCPVSRQSTCDQIAVVPTLMYKGREIGLSDLKRIAEGR